MLLVAAYVALIFAGSSIRGLTPPGPDSLPKDKIAHLLEYFVLGALLVRGIAGPRERPRWSMMTFLLAVAATVAALDELYQSSVPGRDMSAADWVADAVGAAAGIGASALMRRADTGGISQPGDERA
jgi:VanZ family protein